MGQGTLSSFKYLFLPICCLRKRVEILLTAPKVIWKAPHKHHFSSQPDEACSALSSKRVIRVDNFVKIMYFENRTQYSGHHDAWSNNLQPQSQSSVCMCVYVSQVLPLWGIHWAAVHQISHSLAMSYEYLPICFRFNCHTVTLFKITYCSMLPVFVIVYLYITFCWITGFQKYTQVLITNVGGRCCFFLPPDEENEDAERNYMTHVGSLKPLENLSPRLPST